MVTHKLSILWTFLICNQFISSAVGVPDGTHDGCFQDISTTNAPFTNFEKIANLTLDKCRQRCINQTFYAVKVNTGCSCIGITLNLDLLKKLNDSECNSSCPGNATQFCGSTTGYIYSVYLVCPRGKYGQAKCAQDCRCKNNDRCSISGACSKESGCIDGWEENNAGQCSKDVNECTENKHGCNQTCHNYDGGYNCSCNSSYELDSDGHQCNDVDECLRENGGCNQNCSNTFGSYACGCNRGYQLKRGDKHQCENINECSINHGGCYQTCHDTIGSYTCICRTGYNLASDKHKCEDIDECSLNTSGCNQTCSNNRGSYTCSCNSSSFTLALDKHQCEDVNECTTNTSGCNQTCSNNYGSYTCGCHAGFELANDGRQCEDVDECLNNNGSCNQNCNNTIGGYFCSCLSGFELLTNITNLNCTDINECFIENQKCQHYCNNTPGSFICSCKPGYLKIEKESSAEDKYNCTDVNECEEDWGSCDHNCTNTEGSYFCNCTTGYQLNSNGRKCDDFNECSMSTHTCSQTCDNSDGGYSCSCIDGWKLLDEFQCEKDHKSLIIILVCLVVLLVCGVLVILLVIKIRRMNSYDNNSTGFARMLGQLNNRFVPLGVSKENLTELVEPVKKTTDRSKRIVVKDLKNYVEKVRSSGGFEDEFRRIPMVSELKYDIAEDVQLKSKNRFKNILPYNHNRVTLNEVNDDPLSTYINASFIAGYSQHDKIIASHGPTPNTLNDFWIMIWQYEVSAIVMVTKCMEQGKRKCEQYWPLEGSLVHGDLTVTLTTTERWPDYEVSRLKVIKGNTTRLIVHLQFTDWPDHGVPDHATSLLSFRRTVRNLIKTDKYFVVHCSAGVGRTGTFLAIDYLLQQARNENFVDIYEYLRKLRDERMNAVQTLDQYEFIHLALLEGLTLGETVMSCSSFTEERDRLDLINVISGKTFLETQFDMLQDLHPLLSPEETYEARSSDNMSKNRDKKLLPGNGNRVFLTTENSGRNDYINAVFVASQHEKTAFISTQLPLIETLIDFWTMVIDYNSKLIVYLDTSDGTEDISRHLLAPQKCKISIDQHKVWTPTMKPTKLSDECNRYAVAVSKMGQDDDDIYANTEDVVSFKIQILHFIIMTSERSEQAKLLLQVNDHVKNTLHNVQDRGPTVIVSKDGIHLCGEFIAVSNLLEMATKQHEVDVFNAAHNVKKVQPHFFTTLAEYQMLFDVIEANNDYSTYANV